jgi:hypothetical protein
MTDVGTTEADSVKRRAQRWWVVARSGNGAQELLAADRGGEKTVLVFGFVEEAELFWWLEAPGDGWQVRDYGLHELALALGGLHIDVESVALDPLPRTLADRTAGLTSIGRRTFMDRFLQKAERLEDRRGIIDL